jgi:hypothetical protein
MYGAVRRIVPFKLRAAPSGFKLLMLKQNGFRR